MNPYIFNCFLLYVLVVIASLIQCRFYTIKKHPVLFVLFVIFMPIFTLGKLNKTNLTWNDFSGYNIFAYTLMLGFLSVKSIVPKLNELYILMYTLFHWYLLIVSIDLNNISILLGAVAVVSIIPTLIIIKNAFVDEKLTRRNKIILVYWFIFSVAFTYIDQVALDIVHPILTLDTIGVESFMIIAMSAIQVYFISTFLSLVFIAIPLFHMERGARNFKAGWRIGMRNWQRVLQHKLDNYVEYQIPRWLAATIIVVSCMLFYVDYMFGIRTWLILIYTLFLPIVFFYIRYSPPENFPDANWLVNKDEENTIG